jgi:hypothetical protein
MRKHRIIRIFSALLTLLLLTPLVGCGSSGPDPEEVISKAQEAIKEVQSYRVDSTSISTNEHRTTQSSNTAEFVAPDRTHVFPAAAPDSVHTVESIRIGNIEYRKEPDSSNWQVRQWPGSISATNFVVDLTESLSSLVGLENLPDEKVDGLDCFHYIGHVDTKAIAQERKTELDPSQPGYEGELETTKRFENMQYGYEFWIGKEDFLLRQLKTHLEVSYTRNEGEENEREEYQNNLNTYRFYDFDAPITIEAPSAELVEGIYLTVSSTSSIGGKDIQHQQIKYEISISNKGRETARKVRVFIDTPATNQGSMRIEAEPAQSPVNLGPGESETYYISWEYDLTKSSKQELVELMKENVLRAVWIDENSQQQEKVLSEGG